MTLPEAIQLLRFLAFALVAPTLVLTLLVPGVSLMMRWPRTSPWILGPGSSRLYAIDRVLYGALITSRLLLSIAGGVVLATFAIDFLARW